MATQMKDAVFQQVPHIANIALPDHLIMPCKVTGKLKPETTTGGQHVIDTTRYSTIGAFMASILSILFEKSCDHCTGWG